MNENETIKLKKQINLLNEYNAELKSQINEQSLKLGEIQNQYDLLYNKYQKIKLQNNLVKDKDNIQKMIENALNEEKEQNKLLIQKNKSVNDKINIYEQMIKDKNLYINKLEIENNELKRNLINSSKHNGDNIYIEKQKIQKENENMINERKIIVNDFNKICDQMEDIIRENRVLRQMADVPENFGIDMHKIKLGEKIKIEDYKTKIRLLIHQIDELETERAQLKHNIYFLASSFQMNEPPFNLLSKEQKVDLAIYAKKLYEGKNKILLEECDKCKEFQKLLDEKNKYIKELEEERNSKKEIGKYRLNSYDKERLRNNKRYEEFNNNVDFNENNNNKQIEELRNILKQSKDEIERAIDNKQRQSYNKGNIYNLYQYNNNFFFSQNNMNTNQFNNNKRKEKNIFKKGVK